MRSLVLLPLFAALLSATAVAQIPHTISFQGRAETASGPVTGQRNVTIKIWDAASGGTLLFTDAVQPVQFTDGGLFAMAIGANSPGGIPATLFNRPLWVGITIQGVNAGAEFAPRYALHASPYTFRAGRADSVAVADSAARIPWQLGDGVRARISTLDITNSTEGGSKEYKVGLRVYGRPYAVVSDGIDSVDGYLVVSRGAAGSTPATGALYRDNVPVAWGSVASNATAAPAVIAGFGIDSVIYGDISGFGTGYKVYMQRPMRVVNIPGQASYPAMSITVTPILAGQQAIAIASWSPATNAAGALDPAAFYVIVRDSSNRNITSSFSFQVFGALP